MANGTSFSTPFVSGLIALILSENPSLSTKEARANLRNYSIDLGEKDWDQYYGWGLANTNFLTFNEVIPEFPTQIFVPIMLLSSLVLMKFRTKLIP